MKTLTLFITLSMLAGAMATQAAEPAAGATTNAAAPPAPAAKAAATKKPGAKPQDAAKPAASGTPASNVELDTTQITGNRELPRVLYVVPWKRADLGELSGKPTKSLLDEVLAPVDRDVFQRQNRYHDALQPDAAASGATATATAPVEPKVER